MAYTLHPDIPYCNGWELDWFQSATPSGRVVLCFYGGGWLTGSKETIPAKYPEVVTRLTVDGFDLILPNYHLGPNTWPAQIQDAYAALRWVYENAAAHSWSAVYAFGVSAGGHLALLLHAAPPATWPSNGCNAGAESIAAAAAFFPPTDLRNPYFCGNPIQAASMSVFGVGPQCDAAAQAALWNASPLSYLNGGEPPVALWHGLNDTTIPPSESATYVAVAESVGVEAVYNAVPGAGHGWSGLSLAGRRAVATDLSGWLSKH